MSEPNNETPEEILKAKYPKLYEAVFGDGKKLSEQLILSSLFIMAFECLKEFIEDNFQDFFSSGYETAQDGNMISIESENFPSIKERYQEHYKVFSKKHFGLNTKRVSMFQTASAWFHDMQAFTEEDMKLIIGAIQLRNDFAHELYKWVLDEKYPHIDKMMVNGLLNLYFKASNWWICNIEADIMPEDYEKFSEEDMKSAASANVHILQLFLNKTFPDKNQTKS